MILAMMLIHLYIYLDQKVTILDRNAGILHPIRGTRNDWWQKEDLFESSKSTLNWLPRRPNKMESTRCCIRCPEMKSGHEVDAKLGHIAVLNVRHPIGKCCYVRTLMIVSCIDQSCTLEMPFSHFYISYGGGGTKRTVPDTRKKPRRLYC
jgi:hypothetical protein